MKFGFSQLERLRALASALPQHLGKSVCLKVVKFYIKSSNFSEQELEWAFDFFRQNSSSYEISPNMESHVENFVEVLSPPTAHCFHCFKSLHVHNKPCIVSIFGLNGPRYGLKITLRCVSCKINYGYDKFGNEEEGTSFYSEPRCNVVATNKAMFDRRLCSFQVYFA